MINFLYMFVEPLNIDCTVLMKTALLYNIYTHLIFIGG